MVNPLICTYCICIFASGDFYLMSLLNQVNYNQFYSCGSVHRSLFHLSNQRDAVLSSLFIVLQNHSTCFWCPLYPSSGVHKTVVTTTDTSHVCR
jgi:hypothetical protein